MGTEGLKVGDTKEVYDHVTLKIPGCKAIKVTTYLYYTDPKDGHKEHGSLTNDMACNGESDSPKFPPSKIDSEVKKGKPAWTGWKEGHYSFRVSFAGGKPPATGLDEPGETFDIGDTPSTTTSTSTPPPPHYDFDAHTKFGRLPEPKGTNGITDTLITKVDTDDPAAEDAKFAVSFFLTLTYPDGTSKKVTKPAEISGAASDQIESPEFYPRDFGLNTWVHGRYQFTAIVYASGPLKNPFMMLDENDLDERYEPEPVPPEKEIYDADGNVLTEDKALANVMPYEARVKMYADGWNKIVLKPATPCLTRQ